MRTRQHAALISLLALSAVAAAVACAKDSPTSPGGPHPLTGQWGGASAQVTFTQDSTQVLVNCATGQFAGNVALDANGHFVTNGNWNQFFGPISLMGFMPAQLSGQVTGNSMTFAIAVNDTTRKQVSSIGPVTVVYGQPGDPVVCPA